MHYIWSISQNGRIYPWKIDGVVGHPGCVMVSRQTVELHNYSVPPIQILVIRHVWHSTIEAVLTARWAVRGHTWPLWHGPASQK